MIKILFPVISMFQLSDPTYAEVHKKPQLLQYDEVTPPLLSPYSADNVQPSLFHAENEPPASSYIGPVTTQYSEVKNEHMALHITPYNTTAGGGYSLLKRDNILHAPLHNMTTGGDYSVIKRDNVPNAPSHSTTSEGDYSVLKREKTGVS